MGSLNLALLGCRRQQTPGIMDVKKDAVSIVRYMDWGRRRQRFTKNAGLAEAAHCGVGTCGVSLRRLSLSALSRENWKLLRKREQEKMLRVPWVKSSLSPRGLFKHPRLLCW